jgi:hypothetical protein
VIDLRNFVKKIKFFFLLSFLFFSPYLLASGYQCQYLNDEKTKLIKFRFAVDANPKFGTIVPVEVINREEKDDLKIKTVIIKDKPFLVLTDVQRINDEDDRMLLIFLYPERDRIKIVNFSSGKDPGISINHAKCTKVFE